MSKEFKSFFKNVGGGKETGAITPPVSTCTVAVANTTVNIATPKAFWIFEKCGIPNTLPWRI